MATIDTSAVLPPLETLLAEPRWVAEPFGDVAMILRNAEAAEPAPRQWRQRLVDTLQRLPNVVAAGAKRLRGDGTIFSMGEMIVHPKGFHHVGQGLDGQAHRLVEEVDAIAGGVVAIAREPFDACGGEAVLDGLPLTKASPLGLVELCLELRSRGGRVVCVPDVTVVDAGSPHPDDETRRSFRRRFGFDVLAADLDEVRSAPGRRGLLWNVRWHHPPMPFEKYEHRPCMHWRAYEGHEAYRQRADHLVRLVRHVTTGGRVLDLGCGDGLFTHLVAMQGLDAVGIDSNATAIRQATEAVARRGYPVTAPTFTVANGETPPFSDGVFQTIAMLDVIEHLPNPVRVLQQARRLLAPGGHLLLATPAWQHGRWSDPVYHVTEYTEGQLVRQIHAATDLQVVTTGHIGGVYRDVIVVARRTS